MAATGLVSIKRRINSVKSTKKITKAMEMISTSKLRKIRAKLYGNNEYMKTYNDIMKDLAPLIIEQEKELEPKKDRKLVVVFGSDMGLCGGFNSAMMVKLREIAKGHKEDYGILTLGERTRGLVNKYKFETVAEFVRVSDNPTVEDAKEISAFILDLYNNGEYNEVKLLYTYFHSQVKREVVVVPILPLSKVYNETDEGKETREFEVLGEKDKFLENIIEPYLNVCILNAMINSKASENAIRMETMQSANKNADDLIDKLNIKYNRIRQSAITNEISEIIGGAQM